MKIWTSEEEVLNMSNKDLIKEVQRKGKICISDFYEPDIFGNELVKDEWWKEFQTKSVNNKNDAENEIISSYIDRWSISSYRLDFIGENEYYYQFQLEYSDSIKRTVRCIVYNENIIFYTSYSQTGYFFEFRFINEITIKNLLDLQAFFDNNHRHSQRIIYRNVVETENNFIYNYYIVFVSSGDWNTDDEAVLEKREITVNKNTGECDLMKRTEIKRIKNI